MSDTSVPSADLEGRGRVPRLGPVPPLVAWFAVGIVLVALLALVSFAVDGDWILLKVGEESNIPTWFSSVQLFMVAVVLLPIVLRDSERRKPSTWGLALVPGLFLFLSLDEAATIHERLGDWLQGESGIGSGLRSGPDMLVFVPLVAALVLVAGKVFWPYVRDRRRALGLIVAGFVLFGASAVGLEMVSNFVTDGSLIQKVLGFAEEVGEMIAVNLILWAALLIVQDEGIRLDLGRSDPRPSGPLW